MSCVLKCQSQQQVLFSLRKKDARWFVQIAGVAHETCYNRNHQQTQQTTRTLTCRLTADDLSNTALPCPGDTVTSVADGRDETPKSESGGTDDSGRCETSN